MKKIDELCRVLAFPEEVTEKVMDFDRTFDYRTVSEPLEQLKNPLDCEAGRLRLKEALGEDLDGMKMLSCMLRCALEVRETYRKLGIEESIFVETMKCFPRFIRESHEMTGQYKFDRDWWTIRQLSMALFRIGELEYEFVTLEGKKAVSIHIPSDADMAEEKLDSSLEDAAGFMKRYFPEYKDCDYICDSWLLCPALQDLLPARAKILKFQNRFHIVSVKEDSIEYMQWVFRRRESAIEKLPEHTTLQRNMKQYLLKGGRMGEGLGILKKKA